MIIHKDNNDLQVLHLSNDNVGHNYHIGLECEEGFAVFAEIDFQNGAVKANGVNGITNEALLAILIHRTKALNEKFQCKENEQAICGMEFALHALESRTKNRIDRGVEGLDIK